MKERIKTESGVVSGGARNLMAVRCGYAAQTQGARRGNRGGQLSALLCSALLRASERELKRQQRRSRGVPRGTSFERMFSALGFDNLINGAARFDSQATWFLFFFWWKQTTWFLVKMPIAKEEKRQFCKLTLF